MAHVGERKEERRKGEETDAGSFKGKVALKEIRAMFLLLSPFYSFPLIAVGFYMRWAWLVCLRSLVLFLSAYSMTGIELGAEQVKARMTAMVAVLIETK